MKRLVVAALAAGLVAAATSAVAAAGGAGDLPTKKPGTLVVGFDLPAPGFWNGQPSGDTIKNPKGFEVEMARAIARKLGIPKVEFLRFTFTALFTKGPKPFDFALEESTIRAGREKNIDFSTPYFDANQGVLLARGVAVPKSLADLKQLQLCSQATTTGLSFIQTKLRPPTKPLSFQTLSAAFQAVVVGRCEAIVMDVPLVVNEKRARPTRYGPLAGQIFTKEQYGAVFESGSPLRTAVNRAINELKAEGFFIRAAKRWLGIPNLPTLK